MIALMFLKLTERGSILNRCFVFGLAARLSAQFGHAVDDPLPRLAFPQFVIIPQMVIERVQ